MAADLVHQLVENAARAHPDKEAVVDGGRRFRYGDLADAVRANAAALREHGLEPRDRVAVFLDRSFEETVGLLGAARAGGVFVPINGLLRPRQVLHILDDSGARFLVTSARRAEILRDVLAAAGSLERILLVDHAPGPGWDRRVVSAAFRQAHAASAPPAASGEDLVAILYTSGSTGPPKGVMVSHRSLLAGSRIVCRYLGITADERILCVLPLSFDYGLNQLITAVEKGATTILLSFRFADEIVRAIRAERVTGLAGVPTLWVALTERAPSFRREKLSTLRYLTNSGGPVPTEMLDRVRRAQPHVDFFLMYGFTEAFRSTYLPPAELARRPTSIGKAIPETEVMLVNDQGERCRPGEVGILVHDGPTVTLGYWGKPEETAALLRPHPFAARPEGRPLVCYSGDRVKADAEGYLYFVGRDDGLIKSSGYRIGPSEVEEALMSTGLLTQAAVFGLPDPVTGERICAVCVAAGGGEADRHEILTRCARELPQHMLPRDIEFVAELPLSPNGKVDYQALRVARGAAADRP
ncbi:MAG TPA: AMP-binding protein [Candidatus Methylomirabilis sp.]|nr:AMP-binding protein [Candidatus Methylomirabilis sp.]